MNWSGHPHLIGKSHRSIRFFVGIGFLLIISLALVANVHYLVSGNNTMIATAHAYKVNTKISDANTSFGVDVLNNLVAKSPNKNVFISPTSIALALSMVYNGARNDTASEMQHVLHYQGVDMATINKSHASLTASLKSPDPQVTLDIANSVWLQQDTTFQQQFLDVVRDTYKAKAAKVNFVDVSAARAMNAWASNATHGKIPKIIDQTDANDKFYILNAVYFKGQWHTLFKASKTKEDTFTTGESKQIQLPMMSSTSGYAYYEDEDVQAVSLPYGKDQRLAMNVYLPNNMPNFLSHLNHDQLEQINTHLKDQLGTILLPKFTINYGQDLKNPLQALGMDKTFTDSADFNGIAPRTLLSHVLHQTYLSIDEQGTVAAAVTAVQGVALSATPSPETGFYMNVNKPFVITIEDSITKETVFIGVIQNPSSV